LINKAFLSFSINSQQVVFHPDHFFNCTLLFIIIFLLQIIMMKHSFSWERFQQVPIIGILRGLDLKQIQIVAEIYLESGFTNLEVTMNTSGAADAINSLRSVYNNQLNIGAGTVCTIQDLNEALHAGAQFIVTPLLNEEVVRTCASRNIPIFPGSFTPSEIYNAWACGANMVKVFPANILGPAYLKEILAPLNQIKLIPTGGINKNNMIEFFNAGAVGVGMGGGLFPQKLIAEGDWIGLKLHLKEILEIYKSF
jgi:2-dehydro-3-deoxyphosphogluconate aldolase / (4S)-4-hydroxy-2-oxoglutarate aldolase